MARLALSVLCLTLLPVAIGCGPSSAAPQEDEPDQPYPVALKLMCEVDQHAKLDPDEDPIGVEGARLDWMRDHITNPDAIELITLMRVRSNSEKSKMLTEQTNAEKVASCPLAASWKAHPEG
ncbi:MAG: hypothetical protein AB7K71_07985 [Polyangiaceae bacterium]